MAYALGADAAGIAKAAPVQHKERLLRWLASGKAGDMQYLARNIELRMNPLKLMPEARSIIVIGVNYFPVHDDLQKEQRPYRVAKYAWGRDYHIVLRKMLEKLRTRLRLINKDIKGRICVDTAPFMDKYWAQKAGLGWQGKHTNLVSRRFGSWLVLGSLIINTDVDRYDTEHKDHCGRCTACIDACPTGALDDEHHIDATRCLSYLTIESKAKEIPGEFHTRMNGWIFGCDLCLEACPFNRFAKPLKENAFRRDAGISLLESGSIKDLTEKDFTVMFHDSSIMRSGLSGIRRNMLAAAAGD